MTEHEQQQDQAGLFDLDEYMRYGRQMIVPQFGIKGECVRVWLNLDKHLWIWIQIELPPNER